MHISLIAADEYPRKNRCKSRRRSIVLQISIGCGLLGFIGCADTVMKPPAKVAKVTLGDENTGQLVSVDSAVVIQMGEVDGKVGAVDVVGLLQDQLESLKRIVGDDAACRKIFPVYVGEAEDGDRPAMLGSYKVTGKAFRFVPRFGFDPGTKYHAVFRPSAMPNAAFDAAPLTSGFLLPAAKKGEPTIVEHVYPTRSTLPENQLKFYLHFSAPMSQGGSYQYIRLLREDGSEVELPFLELDEELWNSEGTRLTLFIDPGRIKRGVKPREEIGPSLKEGEKFTLVLDEQWPDAAGHPLNEPFRKTFDVAASDRVQPVLEKWQLKAPQAESQQPLEVIFAEPLDHAMLQRVLLVQNSAGQIVDGEITVDREETRWRFQPAAVWKTGKYALVVETILEDLAGNNLSTPFEVDVFNKIDKQVTAETVSREFEVGSADQ